MLRIYLSLIIVNLFLINCSNTSNNISDQKIDSPDEMYLNAKNLFDSKKIDLAKEKFEELSNLYPLSNEAIQSEIMLGFINYLKMDYETSIFQFKKIINLYPSHKDLDYVYYMIALCNYEQINDANLDGRFNDLAYQSFNQVIKRFPESDYAKDSQQKIVLIMSNKASKHMMIGRFYLKERKYTAALNRFKLVVEKYSSTKFTPEALHRIVEIYFQIGLIEESTKTASILGHNYPDSKWYKYSYNLINKTEKQNSLFKKIKNIF